MASMGIPESCQVHVARGDAAAEDLEGELKGDEAIVSKDLFVKCVKIGLAKATSTFV